MSGFLGRAVSRRLSLAGVVLALFGPVIVGAPNAAADPIACRIATPLFPSPDATTSNPAGTGYPTPSQDACVVTPPATAYWSYWLAPVGQHTWTYSPLGAYSDQPTSGEVEAWVYGGTDINGTTGQPNFTPDQIRARTNPTTNTRTLRLAGHVTKLAHPAAATTPDLSTAVQYLVNTTNANNLPGGGTSLAKDGYYESGPQFADWGLTIDGAYALAATGSNNPVLAKIVHLLNTAGTDGGGNSINDWTGAGTPYAAGGDLGKEALLAEITGYDPHHFGGQDLISALDGTVCTAANAANQCTAAGNYTFSQSVFDQALGILAQLRAGDTANAAAPISYLESLQHPSGAWPSLIPTPDDSDVDSTAMAVMALALAPGNTAATAVKKGIAWIAAQQLPDGGFHGAAGDSTNSAALANQALNLDRADYAGQIGKTLAFLAGQQNSDGGFNVAAGGQPGSDVRASTQVVGGIVGTSFGTLTDNLVNTGPTSTTNPPSSTTTTTPTTSTSDTTDTTDTTGTGPTTDAGGSGGVGGADNGTPTALANTGVRPWPLVGAGFGLVLLGLLTLVLRRRFAVGRSQRP